LKLLKIELQKVSSLIAPHSQILQKFRRHYIDSAAAQKNRKNLKSFFPSSLPPPQWKIHGLESKEKNGNNLIQIFKRQLTCSESKQ
jgi:hypothetical protein